MRTRTRESGYHLSNIEQGAVGSSLVIPILRPDDHQDARDIPGTMLWHGDAEQLLDALPKRPIFDLVFTSPPYNIGKGYEQRQRIDQYIAWQERMIQKTVERLKPSGSMCWQTGNFLERRKGGRSSTILPLDIVFHDLFRSAGMKLRNRLIWHFGHGLHCSYRFSGRYEVVMWYTKTDDYTFNLNAIRSPQKYPGKRYFKGPKQGQYSCNPIGKNPEDVWDIPNVKSNHVEKTIHPCQFPVALVDRFVLALTNRGGLVFDPFAGVGSAGVAALIHGRSFWGCELDSRYIEVAKKRMEDAANGKALYRPFAKPVYDHTRSKLSRKPNR